MDRLITPLSQWITLAFVLFSMLLPALMTCCTPPAIPSPAVPTATQEPAVVAPTATPETTLFAPTVPATVAGTPAATPDLAATVVAVQQPQLYDSHLSPDGQWRAEVVRYDCADLGGVDQIAYEQLRLVHVATGDERVVDEQLLFCGGLGAFGLAGLFWSPNGRYFYYTDAREGVPDGCGYWERPLLRLDVASLGRECLGAGPLSPDGEKIATWQGRDLVVWSVDGGEIARVRALAEAEAGPIAWSPDSRALVYLQVASFCPLSGMSYVIYFDWLELDHTLLLESEQPTFGDVHWDIPDELVLFNEGGERWVYRFSTRQLAP